MNRPQSAVHSAQSVGAWVYLIGTAVLAAASSSTVVAQGQGSPPPQARYSTHDFTLPVPGPDPNNFQEWMVDVKTPGDGFTYSTGTITVNRTRPVPTSFSGSAAFPPVAGMDFDLGSSGGMLRQRQIGILQIIKPDSISPGQVIHKQTYFYGSSLPEDDDRATNVRGIAVWPTGVPSTTRVAICGETYDKTLPLSNAPAGWPLATATNSSGFIAVFDGDAVLKWTHHFFGGNVGSSAVTDVCIRVDAVGTDIVTYCGISTHGNPTMPPPPPPPNGTLTPVDPFPPPGPGAAGGATDNGPGQWDGFVGRLVRGPTGPTVPTFHSVVGGVGQDGLFGIAELDEFRFVAVGSTAITTTGGPPPGATFPLTSMSLAGIPGPYAIGVMMVFAEAPPSNSSWALESGTHLGTPSPEKHTVARDVVVQPEYVDTFGLAVVVGSTDDDTLLSSLPGAFPGPHSFGGLVDGFIAAAVPIPASPFGSVLFAAATFRGTAGFDILTGVNAWNEFTDHFVVTGQRIDPVTGSDIEVGSYVIDTDPGTLFTVPFVALTANPSQPLGTGTSMGGTGFDRPTAIGAVNATTLASFSDFGIGDPAGGGIAVDRTGRVNVVGTTNSEGSISGFPATTASPINYVFPAGRNKTGISPPISYDGTRTVLDMLPGYVIPMGSPAIPGAVGRTDGTGQLPTGNATLSPTYPLPGTFGGSTPECALLPFGFQIGVTPTPTSSGHLRRMLIDYLGPVPGPGLPVTLVVSRPPPSFGEVSAWQIGFPGVASSPAFLPGGALNWITSATVTFSHSSSNATLLFPLPGGLPTGSGVVSVQLFALPTGTVGGNPAGGPPPCTTTSSQVATPAMWIQF